MNISLPPETSSTQEENNGRRIYNRGGHNTSARNGLHLDQSLRRARENVIIGKVQDTLDQAMVAEAPIDLHAVSQQLFLVVRNVVMDDVEGSLVTDGEVGGILINSKIKNEHRRRFTLAHEIGHFVLHRHKCVFRDSPKDLRDYASSMTEIEANIFAAMLLMPPSLLPGNFGAEKPRLEQAEDLAERFNVSLEVGLRRIIGQSNWRCALVVSQDGLIKRVVRSPEFDGFIATDRQPHPATMARLLLEADGEDEDATTLPAHAWAEGPIAEEGVQVYEQSRRLTSGYVYTIVTALDPE